ncbi:hypothetical protein ACQ86N_40310 [Puia sp. P3]|uniref:hypothetical protein n=1 Tax=Puia sp. P3 TaxID=3423952 RepID=UPI003D664E8F
MKIVFTGGSSFTGYWFIKELAAQGHAVTAVVRGNSDQYTGLRKRATRRYRQMGDHRLELQLWRPDLPRSAGSGF